jgi:hypothetical protein
VTLSATFDGQQIRLEEDYPLPKNARLLPVTLFWRPFAVESYPHHASSFLNRSSMREIKS